MVKPEWTKRGCGVVYDVTGDYIVARVKLFDYGSWWCSVLLKAQLWWSVLMVMMVEEGGWFVLVNREVELVFSGLWKRSFYGG